MSEYQYYEFRAVDRLLTSDEMDYLRDLSSRAEISQVSFINHYSFGDFKGNPNKLMAMFFDAHVYVANWCEAIFMLRLSKDTLPDEILEADVDPYILKIRAADSHCIITWSLSESEDYGRFAIESGQGWMVKLLPLRDELLRGDFRSLYIGWLQGVSRGMTEDDELEPFSVSGLGNLTPAQMALAEFLEVDIKLLQGCAVGNPVYPEAGTDQQEVDSWIESLPKDKVRLIFRQLLDGKPVQTQSTLLTEFSSLINSPAQNGA